MAQVQHIEEDFKKPTDDKGYLKSWEKVIESDHLKVWRKPIPDSYLFEYKGLSPFFISFLAKKEFNLLFMFTYKLYQQAKNIKTNFSYIYNYLQMFCKINLCSMLYNYICSYVICEMSVPRILYQYASKLKYYITLFLHFSIWNIL